jgi:hypothetical protein
MMQSKSIVSVILLISLSIFISCTKEPPIEQEKFVKIYSEILFAQDTLKVPLLEIKQNVLSRYKFSESDYKKTIEFYNSNPERWQKFFDEVIVYVEKLKEPKKQL